MRDPCFSVSFCDPFIEGYDAWASTYDEDVRRLGYRTPEALADLVERHCPQRDVHLLDIGAGTGLVGEALHRRGYRNITGLDASTAMLNQAVRKCAYRGLVRMDLRDRLGFQDRSFAGIVAGGVYSPGNAPLASLAEIDRLLVDGGWCFISLQWDGIYEGPFQAAIEVLEAASGWRCKARSAVYGPWAGLDGGPSARLMGYQIRPVSLSKEKGAFRKKNKKGMVTHHGHCSRMPSVKTDIGACNPLSSSKDKDQPWPL